ncbi:ABC transporter ATP-binding protein [Microbacterium karelineae]|uniref:ABC transporter ATP-binding protein n=1 Tax=Microbacterium karelineae TaxID=2654283 RepID=UPI0012EACC13|nr:ABC transporter ATP-binding protein [Microbacterium karelineae]
MIGVERLTVRYGRRVAADGVDLRAHERRMLGLIGPNGSGKSTTLRAILGAARRQEGRILVDGRELAACSAAERARLIAVVAQEEVPDAHVTAWDSVLLGRSVHRTGWRAYDAADEERAADAMRRAGVLHLAPRHVHLLSGGERQRVLIARALAQGASHLLLDEPTNHLDVRYQHEVLALVRALHQTSIVVLHDLNLAARYCDDVVLLEEGRVVASGTPAEVLRPEILEPVYRIRTQRIDAAGVPQLLFGPPEPQNSGTSFSTGTRWARTSSSAARSLPDRSSMTRE